MDFGGVFFWLGGCGGGGASDIVGGSSSVVVVSGGVVAVVIAVVVPIVISRRTPRPRSPIIPISAVHDPMIARGKIVALARGAVALISGSIVHGHIVVLEQPADLRGALGRRVSVDAMC